MQKSHRPVATVSAQNPTRSHEASSHSCIIAIGELAPEVLPNTQEQTVVFAELQEVTAELLLACEPSLVVSPLVGRGFDCFDVAERLAAQRFTGPYRAVVDTLPDPSVVRREIRGHFPDLDFDILVLS